MFTGVFFHGSRADNIIRSYTEFNDIHYVLDLNLTNPDIINVNYFDVMHNKKQFFQMTFVSQQMAIETLAGIYIYILNWSFVDYVNLYHSYYTLTIIFKIRFLA